MGFNQRQAGGKFTRDEAQALIDQLEAEGEGSTPGSATAPPSRALLDATDDELAAELIRRGWRFVDR
jgi:hypothetical protein